MTIERYPIVSRDQWLKLRKGDVTASVVAALFGSHPYVSKLRLNVEKRGVDFPDLDSPILRRGRWFEAAAVAALAEVEPTWTLTKAHEYIADTEARIGATPDFYVKIPGRGHGVLQVKTIARKAVSQWAEGPPFWVSLQTLTEAMLHNAEFGIAIALVIDPWKPDCIRFEVPRHWGAEERIREAVREFWEDIEAGREPAADYGRDSELLSWLFPKERRLKTVDLRGDNRLPEILADRARLRGLCNSMEKEIDAIETEIKDRMGEAEIGSLTGWRVTWKCEPRPGHVVGPSNPRVLRVTDQRESLDDGRPF